MKRVGIIGLLHESNTFIEQPTTIQHFHDNLMVAGEEVRRRLESTHHEIGGFFAGLADATDVEAVPIFVARAVPFGTIEKEAMTALCEAMERAWSTVGQLDGVLVAPHGATVSEAIPDVDGHWLSQVRSWVGPNVPIIGTLDAHANLSAQMVAATDALIAYRSNPHLDQRQRGIEAAQLMLSTLRGNVRPVQEAAFPPMIINIERQHTSEPHLRPLYDLADEQLLDPAVLSNSILLGFPYADVEEMGSAFIAVTDNDRALARRTVDGLARAAWDRRADFVGQLTEIDRALEQVEQATAPVCLLDMGDNVGGGSPGDSTILLHAVRDRAVRSVFACLYDPQAVQQAIAVGIGGKLSIAVGARCDALHGEPFRADFTVKGLYDGKFREPQVRHGGFTDCDQRETAVLVCEPEMTIMLTTVRMPPFSLQQLYSCGLDPASFRALIAKGVNAPVAAYREVCDLLIRVNTPGVTTADLSQLEFRRRRRMYPFESDVTL